MLEGSDLRLCPPLNQGGEETFRNSVFARSNISLNAYWAYGLRIHSELDCPELLPHGEKTGDADVTIHLLPSEPETPEPLENGYYEVHPGIFRLAVPGVARYRIEEGSRIFIQPLPDVPVENIRLFLLGSAMGALLYQRGLFPLHGSAVETRWGAMIFVGAQGAGKSTLAAQFHRRGYRLLSDDVCAVRPEPDRLQILPALAKFRLCADAFERMGTPEGARFDVDKYLVPMGEGYCPHPVPLRAIHILTYHEKESFDFQVIRGFDRVRNLLKNLYRPQYLKGQRTQSDLMRMAGLIAQQTTLATVARQRSPESVDALVDFLESAWSERFDLVTTKEKN